MANVLTKVVAIHDDSLLQNVLLMLITGVDKVPRIRANMHVHRDHSHIDKTKQQEYKEQPRPQPQQEVQQEIAIVIVDPVPAVAVAAAAALVAAMLAIVTGCHRGTKKSCENEK